MMSNNISINTRESSIKTPLKWLEVPIQKFNAAVSHFVEALSVHHSNFIKLKMLGQWENMQREHSSASRIVKQLTCLLDEIDMLRNQVAESELSKFDKLISESKQSAFSAIKNHQDNDRSNRLNTDVNIQSRPAVSKDYSNLSDEEQGQLQVIADTSEDIRRQEQKAKSLEELHENIEDVHSIFQQLSQLVGDQEESVEKIEGCVEKTHVNVQEGERMLCQAAKYKSGMYPLVGALIGSVFGGPVGLWAGFKLGSLTAVGCGFIGFTGGRFLKHQNEISINNADSWRKENHN